MAIREAPLRSTKYGHVPDGEGWFVLNARESRWRDYGPLGAACNFEGKRPFKQLGVNLNVLEPGEPMSMYHRENNQEGFLELAGECVLIVEGETRPLRTWGLLPLPGRDGARDRRRRRRAGGRAGRRRAGGRKGIVYEVAAAALKYGAGVDRKTTESAEAYARFPVSSRSHYRESWLPDR